MKHLNKILCMAMFAFAAVAFTSCGDDEPEVKLPDEIVLSTSELSLLPGESAQITAHVYPEDATDKTVLWSVDGTGVMVNDKGIVTATGTEGSATVTATAKANTAVKATCIVIVGEPKAKDNTFVFNGKTYNIVNAGLYHNEARKGYNIVFADSKDIDLRYEVTYEAISPLNLVAFDFPESQMGKKIIDPTNLGEENWKFHIRVGLNGNLTNLENNLISISRYADYSGGTLKVDVSAKIKTDDGATKTLQLKYEGIPDISLRYIL